MIEEDALIEFTAFSRCDGCGARACSLARRDDMVSELMFCFHHRNKYIHRLLDEGWEIVDGTDALEMLAERGERVNV